MSITLYIFLQQLEGLEHTYLTLVTHCSGGLRLGFRSPCAKATSHQNIANSSQLHRKVMEKITRVKRHLRSTKVVTTSCRNLPCSRMFLCDKLHEPLLAMKRALFTRSLNTGLRGIGDTSAGENANSSGMMLLRGSIIWAGHCKRSGKKTLHSTTVKSAAPVQLPSCICPLTQFSKHELKLRK